MPPNTKERKDLIALLRKKGNYLVNTEMCGKPVKKPIKYHAPYKYLPCTHCLGFYSAKNLWRHRKNCLADSNGSNVQSEAQNFLVRHLNTDQNLKDKVFPSMRADAISLVAKKDTLICAFGARYLKTHRKKHIINITSRKMRELVKLLMEIKKFIPRVKPKQF